MHALADAASIHHFFYCDFNLEIFQWEYSVGYKYLGIGKHLLKACFQELPEMKQEQLCMLTESSDQVHLGPKYQGIQLFT